MHYRLGSLIDVTRTLNSLKKVDVIYIGLYTASVAACSRLETRSIVKCVK
jgi:hypothetical protein